MPIHPPPAPPPPPSALFNYSQSGPPSNGQMNPKKTNDRSMLLNDIQRGKLLKKATTNDRSVPIITGRVIGENSDSRPPPSSQLSTTSQQTQPTTINESLGALFAGGMLRKPSDIKNSTVSSSSFSNPCSNVTSAGSGVGPPPKKSAVGSATAKFSGGTGGYAGPAFTTKKAPIILGAGSSVVGAVQKPFHPSTAQKLIGGLPSSTKVPQPSTPLQQQRPQGGPPPLPSKQNLLTKQIQRPQQFQTLRPGVGNLTGSSLTEGIVDRQQHAVPLKLTAPNANSSTTSGSATQLRRSESNEELSASASTNSNKRPSIANANQQQQKVSVLRRPGAPPPPPPPVAGGGTFTIRKQHSMAALIGTGGLPTVSISNFADKTIGTTANGTNIANNGNGDNNNTNGNIGGNFLPQPPPASAKPSTTTATITAPVHQHKQQHQITTAMVGGGGGFLLPAQSAQDEPPTHHHNHQRAQPPPPRPSPQQQQQKPSSTVSAISNAPQSSTHPPLPVMGVGAMEPLSTMAGPMIPPPPPRSTSCAKSVEQRFHFLDLSQLPLPPKFEGFLKDYSTEQGSSTKNSKKRLSSNTGGGSSSIAGPQNTGQLRTAAPPTGDSPSMMTPSHMTGSGAVGTGAYHQRTPYNNSNQTNQQTMASNF